jgi:hypothetical protein
MALNKLVLETDGLVVGNGQLIAQGGGIGISNNLVISGNLYANSFNNFKLPSAALSNTAIPGTFEYDGTALYGTSLLGQRGVIPGYQYIRLENGWVGSQITTAQGVFGQGLSGVGVGVNLSSNTIYQFEALYSLYRSTGTNSHTFSLSFGGSAILNNISYLDIEGDANATIPYTLTGAPRTSFINSAAASAATGGLTASTQVVYRLLRGSVSIKAGGSFIPQYVLSAAPGGVYTTQPGSYFAIYPVGVSGNNTTIGSWA